MNIKTISSSSKGCSYIVESGKHQIIIEAGVPLKRIREALNHDLSKVVACLVSHEHVDHAHYLKQIEKQTKQLEEQKPKVEFAESIECNSDCITMKQMADIHFPFGRNTLMRKMRDKKILTKENSNRCRHKEF